jgi:hypothetical protein
VWPWPAVDELVGQEDQFDAGRFRSARKPEIQSRENRSRHADVLNCERPNRRSPFRNFGCFALFFEVWARVHKEWIMKYVLAILTAASICAGVPASAEEVGVGVGVGPAGAGVTVGQGHRDRDRDRTTVIKEREREPRDTTVIKERDREPDRKVIIDRDRN